MTSEEQELSECFAKLFEYCNKHDTCGGCIFYRQIVVGPIGMSYCKVLNINILRDLDD